MAESIALSVLENLVHMTRQDFPVGYVCIEALIPAEIEIVSEQNLRFRIGRRALSSPLLGDWWIENKASAVLEVESVIVPNEHNYLLNPAHPDFGKIIVNPPALFHFDSRLFL
jgi:RES domain-containing protein